METPKEPQSQDQEEIDQGSSISSTTTTRRELWAYYIYFIGNNGLTGFNFGPSQFQNLIYLAGYDPTQEPFTTPCNANGCVLPYLGRTRDGQSISSDQEANIDWLRQ